MAFASRERAREYQREYDARNRERLFQYHLERREQLNERIDAIKLERGCADCGYREHAVALDFDHRPGELKLASVAHMKQGSWERISREIAKCDVVCANCHRVRTLTRLKGTCGTE